MCFYSTYTKEINCGLHSHLYPLTIEVKWLQTIPAAAAAAAAAAAKLLQSCPTLCDPIDGSPPGLSVHGISQARILEWVAISLSRGSS